jgi:hypothetical protein
LLLADVAASERLFRSERHLIAFRSLAATNSVQEALATADPGASEVLLRLAVEETDSDPEEAVARLVQEAAEHARRDLVANADDPLAIAHESGEVKLAIEALLEPNTRRSAIEQLLTWLGSRSEDRV